MGALTNKPMAFNSRNWEYNTQVTKDLTDFLSPRIRVDQFSGKIYRILPTVEWISNKIRFLYLGLKNQRIVTSLSTYKVNFKISLSNDKLISYEKKIIITTNFLKVFNILRARLLRKRNKNVNVILGSVFESGFSLASYESKNTKINQYLELSATDNINSLPELNNYKSCILFGINPRMESPLLNLAIKEKMQDVYSQGNFSFSYFVKVLSNNNSFFIKNYSANFMSDSLAIFGLSSIKLNSLYKGDKALILPIYYYNNIINTVNINNNKKLAVDENNDVNLYLAPQALVSSNNNSFNVIVTSHFEKINGSEGQSIRVPVNSYLESTIKFYNNKFKLETINSLKPSFGFADLSYAFSLFTFNKSNKVNHVNQKLSGFNIKNNSFKNKLFNKVIANSIPNYLLRDPLGRANPLFNKQ